MNMARHKHFPPIRQHALERHGLTLDPNHVTGSCPTFNPTHARFTKAIAADEIAKTPTHNTTTETPIHDKLHYAWRSRDNRKGRHVLILPRNHPSTPSRTSRLLRGLGRMCTVWAYWDISWWIAVLFSVGSAIFIVCALFYWLPIAYPSTEFAHESGTGGGIASFVGATLFQVGAVLLVFESVNENQTGCFGWAVEALFVRPAPEGCVHHHQRRGRREGGAAAAAAEKSPEQEARQWTWFPSWKELRGHYFHEIGFVANITLSLGATIFYITGVLSLPGVFDLLSQEVLWGVYWLSYLVGGILFVVASALYMLETQTKWWKPAWGVIGWHIGLWNMIGSVGWTLSASFGYCSPSWCEYQSDLTLLWASFAFLVGSLLLWFEALDKYPIETE